ncbi:hypothetical protein A2U01_0042447 [Trifolium medium]|uniref:Uncharacterized protein n=1 Tax=Trifolium medium TaxID=97028 RepID=A0A392QAC7_9FABA|nr:hypothetical protein [Trifolium medium]
MVTKAVRRTVAVSGTVATTEMEAVSSETYGLWCAVELRVYCEGVVTRTCISREEVKCKVYLCCFTQTQC